MTLSPKERVETSMYKLTVHETGVGLPTKKSSNLDMLGRLIMILKDEKYSILVELFFPWDCSYPKRTFKCIKKLNSFVLATVWTLEVAMALFLCV